MNTLQTVGTITPQFQLHIPVDVRKISGLTKHGKVTITAGSDEIIIQPFKSKILALSGKYKVKNPIPAERMREYIDYGNL